MPDDWSWFLSSEYGRDRMLREEVEGLQRTAYASSAQSARLSSQLRSLQGSIETRLQALSTAFDAYVELGDVREQLAGYPDSSAIRRDALKGLAALAQGGVPDRIDGRGIDYWLVDAMNEVIDVASGAEPPARPAGPSSQEHEMFVVATLGWLGRGERVASRVAPLLIGDGALAAPQVLLWRAVVHGRYGDVLETVRSSWQADLDQGASTWDRFVRSAARTGDPEDVLEWIRDLLDGRWSPTRAPDAPVTDDGAALRSLVDALVGAGLGDERTLLERARVLRARIEEPGAREDDAPAEPARTATTELVQQALLDPDVAPGTRLVLAGWVREGFEATAVQVAAAVAADQPLPPLVRTELGDLEVGVDGPDPTRLAQLDDLAAQRYATPRSRFLAPGVAGGVTLVVGLVLLATQAAAWGVFLLVVTLVLAVVLVRELLKARGRRAELAEVQQRTRERIDKGQAVAASVRSASLETKTQVAGLARAITTPAPPEEPGRS